ncbi:estradiol 17-beta-dehydrogenase 11-like isoform X1 [Sceloporus undulatus]|uniref:estradiol 17-beta-dehydrogenase 11-like isoform X1 n=1 Tax=Sceloporus undulatus TaxID=8520 RepID=UPI001C4D7FC8|nr:estradiol 17-beta-dehydrogenase 11-like isoform X1 [Sceloporus undulatus]
MHVLLEIPLFFLIVLYSYLEAFVKLFISAKKKSIAGELVLITGSGHGLGRATAYEFAKHQCELVLWDINKRGVEETAEECRRLGATAHAFVVDCSKKEDIYKAAEKVKEEIGNVSILMNNAGVIAPADVVSTDDHDIQKIFEVNILAHYWTIKAFLPTMMRNNYGHVVTVASAGGHLVAPFLVAYWCVWQGYPPVSRKDVFSSPIQTERHAGKGIGQGGGTLEVGMRKPEARTKVALWPFGRAVQ